MFRFLKFSTIALLFVFTNTLLAAQLPDALKNAMKQGGFDNKGLGIYVQAIGDTKPLLDFQSKRALNPASVIKLVTTAAALARLGPGYRWSTDVYYQGKLNGDHLQGNLYFRGNGDPYLTPERFWLLLNRVFIYGIKNISGDILLDSTYFTPDPENYAAFDEQPYRTYNVGPNALLVGFQATEFHFDSKDNQVDISVFPASPKIHINNKVRLTNGKCGRWQKRLTMEAKPMKDILEVSFRGRYAKSCDKKTLYRRVTDADNHFQHFFLPLWRQLGGSFEGGINLGQLPQDAKLAIKGESISLAEAVQKINKFSNNVMTRQVLLSLGAKTYGAPGTTQKGIQAVTEWLKETQLFEASIRLDNGAGLSRDTRINAATLGRLLLYVFSQAYMPEFVASLPVTGYDGSMAHRFKDSPLLGHAHIKTGLLDFVQSMAGYVTTASGKRYVVVMLHNHPRAHTKAGEQLQNTLIRWLFEK